VGSYSVLPLTKSNLLTTALSFTERSFEGMAESIATIHAADIR